MAWVEKRDGSTVRLVGTIGDPLAIHIVAHFDEPIDFTGHTWLAQIRRVAASPTPTATFELVEDNTSVDVEGETATLDLLFRTPTTMLSHGVEYVYGIKTISGTYTNWTLVEARPLVGHIGAARSAP